MNTRPKQIEVERLTHALAVSLIAAGIASDSSAQLPASPPIEGTWEPPFNHNGTSQVSFNAIHMALIPKPSLDPARNLQGKVFVMTWAPLTKTGSVQQPYAILDVSGPTPAFTPQIHTMNWANQRSNPPLPNVTVKGDLFCSHHIWTRDGNLFLAGGNISLANNSKLGQELKWIQLK